MKYELKDLIQMAVLLAAFAFGYGDLNSRMSRAETDIRDHKGQAVQIGQLQTSMGNIEKGISDLKTLIATNERRVVPPPH